MPRTRLSKFLAFCFTLTLSATGSIDAVFAVQSDLETGTREGARQIDPQNLTGKITDIITTSGITYVQVDTGDAKVWAAGMTDSALSKGDTISFSTAMPMENFHSKSLDRDFAVIYFVKQFVTGNRATKTKKPSEWTGTPRDPHAPAAPAARTPAEVVTGNFLREASLDGLNTGNRSLSEYKGKPLVINVWASWCGPCRDEMGSLERLAKRYNGTSFNIIGISTDDYRDKATAFIDQAEVSFENYIDHGLLMENMLGASTIPLTVLVSADGRVLKKIRGSREWDNPEIVKAIGSVFQIELL